MKSNKLELNTCLLKSENSSFTKKAETYGISQLGEAVTEVRPNHWTMVVASCVGLSYGCGVIVDSTIRFVGDIEKSCVAAGVFHRFLYRIHLDQDAILYCIKLHRRLSHVMQTCKRLQGNHQFQTEFVPLIFNTSCTKHSLIPTKGISDGQRTSRSHGQVRRLAKP